MFPVFSIKATCECQIFVSLLFRQLKVQTLPSPSSLFDFIAQQNININKMKYNFIFVLALIAALASLGHAGDKGHAIILGHGWGPTGGGLIVTENNIVSGAGFGGQGLVLSHGKKGRNIILGKRKRRSTTYWVV